MLEGDGALDAIAATFTNEGSALSDGQSQYTLCCNDDGGVVDDCIVYRLAADRWIVIPNAANTPAVTSALSAAGIGVDDRSRQTAVIAVQGPRSLEVADGALGLDVGGMAHLAVAQAMALDEIPVTVCRTGYTGEVGCELLVEGPPSLAVWDALLAAGATPCGLGARDTLRLEMGYPLHGNDLSVDVTPWEAGVGWAVTLDRGQFTGQAALRAAKESGAKRTLWGLRSSGRRPLRAGCDVLVDGDVVGATTSGGFSPTLGVGIALGHAPGAAVGDAVTVDVRGTEVACEVVRPPFVDRSPKG
jgi:aminomethyltransferase